MDYFCILSALQIIQRHTKVTCWKLFWVTSVISDEGCRQTVWHWFFILLFYLYAIWYQFRKLVTISLVCMNVYGAIVKVHCFWVCAGLSILVCLQFVRNEQWIEQFILYVLELNFIVHTRYFIINMYFFLTISWNVLSLNFLFLRLF